MGLAGSHYVTRTEYETHINQQVTFKDNVVQEIKRELETTLTEQLATMDQKIQDLRQELASTQLSLMHLELKLSEFPTQSLSSYSPSVSTTRGLVTAPPSSHSHISTTAIDAVVKDFLADPDLNLPLIPDSIEAKIYRKLIQHALAALAKMTDQVRLDLLGHQIRIVLEPHPPN